MATKTTSATTPSLFDIYGLNREMNPDHREEFLKKHKYAPLHCMIGLDEPLDAIVQKMDEFKNEVKKYINAPLLPYQLAPLHIAVLKGNCAVAEKLIKYGARAQQTDAFSFSPWLHTAFLADGAAMKKLLESDGYTPSSQDIIFWDQVKKLVAVDSGFPDRVFVKTKKVEWSPLASNHLSQFQMEKFFNSIYFPPESYKSLWHFFFKFKNRTDIEQMIHRKIAERFEAPFPALCIFLNPQFANPQKGFSLRALAPLEQGDPVDMITGIARMEENTMFQGREEFWKFFEELVAKVFSENDYEVRVQEGFIINTFKQGNATRFINDGWPLVTNELFNLGQSGMLALQKIPKGTELTSDYGSGCPNLKWGRYHLLNSEEMESFYKSHPSLKGICYEIMTLYDRMMKLKKNPDLEEKILLKVFLEIINLKLKVNFLLNTPLALIYICLKNIISADEIIQLFKGNSFHDITHITEYPCHYVWITTLLSLLKQFQDLAKNLSKEKQKETGDYFITNILTKLPVPMCVKGLNELILYVKNGRLDEFLGQSWIKRLKKYDWKNDPEFLFCRMTDTGLTMRKEHWELLKTIGPLFGFLKEFKEVVVLPEVVK